MDSLEIKKIEEFLDKESTKKRLPKYERAVILADSKGNYLRTEQDSITKENLEIVWWTQSGRNTISGLKHLVKNIHELRDGKPTIVLFWHFTCDVTKKEGKYISPRFDCSETLLDHITPILESLKEIHFLEDTIDVGILEAPPVFTKKWNDQKDHTNKEQTNDKKLNEDIKELNKKIRIVNEILNFNSPRFECDFIHRRRNRKKGQGETKTKESLNPILLKDGVHPISIVAQKWLLKIVQAISKPTK